MVITSPPTFVTLASSGSHSHGFRTCSMTCPDNTTSYDSSAIGNEYSPLFGYVSFGLSYMSIVCHSRDSSRTSCRYVDGNESGPISRTLIVGLNHGTAYCSKSKRLFVCIRTSGQFQHVTQPSGRAVAVLNGPAFRGP